MRALKEISRRSNFAEQGVRMDGYILVATPLDQIPDRQGRDWPILERDFPLLRQEGDYVRRILAFS